MPTDTNIDPTRNRPIPLDPLSLTMIGIAAWMTDLMVARRFGEALWRQGTLMGGVMSSFGPGRPR
jgi:hypothetical protein